MPYLLPSVHYVICIIEDMIMASRLFKVRWKNAQLSRIIYCNTNMWYVVLFIFHVICLPTFVRVEYVALGQSHVCPCKAILKYYGNELYTYIYIYVCVCVPYISSFIMLLSLDIYRMVFFYIITYIIATNNRIATTFGVYDEQCCGFIGM